MAYSERALSDYFVPKQARLLASVDSQGNWYFKGKRIVDCEAQCFRDECTVSWQVSLRFVTDDGFRHHVYSTDSELPTTIVPRSYRKHVNQQLLKDINHG